MSKIEVVCVALLGFMFSHISYADEFSLGGALKSSKQPYKAYDTKNTLLPYVNYKTNSFYVIGLTAGYYLYSDVNNKVSAMVYLPGNYFSPKKSKDKQLRELDKRSYSLMGGVTWVYDYGGGGFKNSIAVDTLGKSNGIQFDSSIYYKLTSGGFSFVPALGVKFNNGKYNNYYYGVSDNESARSGLNEFNAKSSANPYVALGFEYLLSENVFIFSQGSYAALPDRIKNSPMVHGRDEYSLTSGFVYNF